ncbi:hypothetical protein [Ensifer sp. LCM 4579]|uniref:hypothetical protein n=1 Tax=Ensifer sp. LCM 4579 TaxID=1848292 RepID=UPI0008D90EFA|nr:hypothetical protein [Ensifer sp. LCM 4579]OHV72683.1 hypothetical protein LCM4579_11310 [Ensifer sp. LCM 4579]
MFEAEGEAFFAALRDAVAKRLGADHPCFPAFERAAGGGGADATLAVQDALNALGTEMATVLMADTHKALRENPAVIPAGWQPSGTRH